MEWKKLAQPKVLGSVAVGLAVIWLLAPNALSGVVSLAVLAACPLSMVFMMKAMGGMGRGNRKAGTGEAPEADATQRELAELRAEVEALEQARGQQRSGRLEQPQGPRDQLLS